MTVLIGRLTLSSFERRVRPSITGMLISVKTIFRVGSVLSLSRASWPFRANTNSYSPSLIFFRNLWRINSSRSGSSSTTRALVGTSSLLSGCVLGQGYDELRVLTGFALDANFSVVLVYDDV